MISDPLKDKSPSVDRRVLASLIVRVGAYVALAVILTYFALYARGFTSPFNLQNVLEQSAILTILAYGMTFVFIGTGTDIQKRRRGPIRSCKRGFMRRSFSNSYKPRIS